MRVRIIKNEGCLICQEYLPRLDKVGFKYELYDADADENQNELDKWGIDELPVIQLVDEANVVRHQFPPRAILSPRAINYKIKEITQHDRRHNEMQT